MMCHERYHIDSELRAVVNTMVGLPEAKTPADRERYMDIARMTVDKAVSVGLLYALELGFPLPKGVRKYTLVAKVSAIQARLSADAYNWLARDEGPSVDEVPF